MRIIAGRSRASLRALGWLALAGALAGCAATPQAPEPSAATSRVNPQSWPRTNRGGLVDPAVEAEVSRWMARMSLEEKVGQVIQADISFIKPEDLRAYPLGSILAGGGSGVNGNDKAPASAWLDLTQAFYEVSAENRPGHTPIPVLFGIDAVHGNNNVPGATIFPHNIGLGAARDPALVRRIGQATARETAVIGVDWTFAPTLAVARDDRWGRTYESYSEEPGMVAEYAGAMVAGLQGERGGDAGLGPASIVATPKHFLGDGGTEEGDDQGDTRADEKELIRIHAAGYRPAIEAGALTVMVSYSSWQGRKMHGHAGLLTDVLKTRMGFDGLVVGDYNGHEQVPGCTKTDCAAAFNAGVDLYMAPDSWKGLYDSLLRQVRSGEISQARLDDAVRRILRVKAKAGLLGGVAPKRRAFAGRYGELGAPAHRALAREAVRKSLVLLKNNGGVLPLRPAGRILVAGSGADDIARQSGGWTISWQGDGNTNADFPQGQSIWGGIQDAVRAAGGSAEFRADGAFTVRPDAAVVVFGEEPYAEGHGDRTNLDFEPEADLQVMRRLKAQGVPVVAVLLSGRPLWVNPELNAADAFVAAWLPGTEGGGVADVLLRRVDDRVSHDFTGRLSFSWPKRPDQGRLNRTDPGYDPLFPYGYGLTYASRSTVPVLPEARVRTAQR